MAPDDFASLLETSTRASGGLRRLKKGELVEGTVVQIASDVVYVDLGTQCEARISRESLLDANGELRIKLGDKLQATVIDARMEAPVLSVGFGRGTTMDLAMLRTAHETKMPVTGTVLKIQKGGLEIDISGMRAFCPASQMELSYVNDLSSYEGQEHEFLVIELRDNGRSIVVSRRALLEARRQAEAATARARIVIGAEIEGTVTGILKHGAIVDMDGVDGFIHVSELAPHRVERPEDVVSQGARVTVRVLGIESTEKGERIRLSLRQTASSMADAAAKVPDKEEILAATVVKAIPGGLVIKTAKGEGFLPSRELELPPGADHRRGYPVGKELRVVLATKDSKNGRLVFSVKGVASVEERQNLHAFGKSSAARGGFGSLGDLLKGRLADTSKTR